LVALPQVTREPNTFVAAVQLVARFIEVPNAALKWSVRMIWRGLRPASVRILSSRGGALRRFRLLRSLYEIEAKGGDYLEVDPHDRPHLRESPASKRIQITGLESLYRPDWHVQRSTPWREEASGRLLSAYLDSRPAKPPKAEFTQDELDIVNQLRAWNSQRSTNRPYLVLRSPRR
jgi:hypothetical protein